MTEQNRVVAVRILIAHQGLRLVERLFNPKIRVRSIVQK